MRHGNVVFCAIALTASACQVNQQAPASEATEGSETTVEVVEQPASTPAQPAAQAAPVVLTQEQKLAKYDACAQAWLGAKWDEVTRDCLTSDVTSEMPGSGMPALKGVDAAVNDGKSWHSAISEMKFSPLLLIVSGDTFVQVAAYTGKHTGALAGVPATGNSLGIYGAEIADVGSDGRVRAQSMYMDMATLMGQVGASKAPHRKAIVPAGTPRTLAIASGSEQEKANLEIARAAVKSWNEADWKTFNKAFAKGWLHRDIAVPQDQHGNAATAHVRNYKKAFPDGKLTEIRAFAAGDYVAIEQRYTGTNTGRNPAMGLTKPTGKAVDTKFLQVFKVQDGKIAEGWEINNSTEMALQLGLMQPPGAEPPPAEKPAPAPAATPATPATPAEPAQAQGKGAEKKATPATPAAPATPAQPQGKGPAQPATPAVPATPAAPAQK